MRKREMGSRTEAYREKSAVREKGWAADVER